MRRRALGRRALVEVFLEDLLVLEAPREDEGFSGGLFNERIGQKLAQGASPKKGGEAWKQGGKPLTISLGCVSTLWSPLLERIMNLDGSSRPMGLFLCADGLVSLDGR